ncbi:CATRA conflict system CASPASE/TPR repeat-associated protein [Actinomadura sp. WMMB 499]|uniref:CATRA conflict system CASPASE/TPR repeat-associated protein n=1 Tax=Actinomadura sp. WMMB 499 TaxID=1219491 RepID=UPI0012473E2C|nr:CATRA conflict system CASPASE/TPR repeat-associated protein [Actinomadura sp. WMMB 499]QFG24612.1 nucleotide-binding protein [Actinomadura sp. WMMB 499]
MPPDVHAELVVHLFAPADGPRAPHAFRALRDLWDGARHLFRMDDPIPGTGLPRDPPDDASTGGERPLAARENPDDDYQAVLRRHHDAFVLSVALAPRLGGTGGPAADAPGWGDLDRWWSALAAGRTGDLLGEARVYLATGPGLDPAAAPALPPPDAGTRRPAGPGATVRERLGVWDLSAGGDDRARRDLLVTGGPDAGEELSALAWSAGHPAVPPLGRYLLHAAKLRYELRVWNRDGRVRELLAAVEDGTVAGARARAAVAELRALRRTVEIADANMGRALDAAGAATAGPFADDRDLARWLLDSLDDASGYLEAAADRADHLAAAAPPPAAPPPAAPAAAAPPPAAPAVEDVPRTPAAGPPEDASRGVFVVHGRDTRVRDGMFAFLRACGLEPYEWETLVARTGETGPYLGEVVVQGIARAQAVVVLLTPDDSVRLDPRLRNPDEDPFELGFSGQARPNVLVELGMALALCPERTILLHAGSQRPIADLGGRNFIRLSDGTECRDKIRGRLRAAGCPVGGGQDWLTAGTLTSPTTHPQS